MIIDNKSSVNVEQQFVSLSRNIAILFKSGA